jgi:hypothetical protein
LNENDIDNLSSIECKLELSMNYVATEQIYQLLERIGGLVKSLTIGEYFTGGVYKWEISVERLLAACPNLERFRLDTREAVVQDDNYVLPLSAFKNYQRYEIEIYLIAIKS